MKNIRIYILSMVCMLMVTMMVGCGSNGAANINVDVLDVEQDDKDYDFRNSNWGDSIDEVKKSEDLKLEYEEDNSVGYSGGKVSGLDVVTMYKFDKDDKLFAAMYGSTEDHTNKNLYIDDYNKLKDALTEKYGEPFGDEDMLWDNDLYKDDKDEYGMAVSVGHLTYLSMWNLDDTKISLMLSGDNFDVSLSLFYEDVNNKQKTDLSGL